MLKKKLILEKIELLGKTIRWSSWSNTKLIFFIVSIGMIILEADTDESAFNYYLVFLLLFLFFIIYGSLISMTNDYWDKLIDKKAGKDRPTGYMNQSFFVSISTFFFLALFVILYYLTKPNLLLFLMGTLMVLLAIFYSSPPLRLKEKPGIDIIVGSLIQRSLPVLLIFLIFDYKKISAYIFIGILFLLGLRAMLMHQIEDFPTDQKSGVRTLLTTRGIIFGKRLIFLLYIPEIILIFLFSASFKTLHLILCYSLFWFIFYLLLSPRDFSANFFSLNEFPLSGFYYVWLPLYISISVFFRTGNPLLILLTLFLQKKHILIFLKRINFNSKFFRRD